VPSSVDWVIDSARACTWCSSPTPQTCLSAAATEIRPSTVSTGSSLHPSCRSGAPHSSVWMCAVSAHTTASYERSSVPSDSTFAPVPLNTRCAWDSGPKCSANSRFACVVHGSAP
jgi:hypothetical protein